MELLYCKQKQIKNYALVVSKLALDRKKEQLTIYKCGGGFQLEAVVLEANTVGCQGGT